MSNEQRHPSQFYSSSIRRLHCIDSYRETAIHVLPKLASRYPNKLAKLRRCINRVHFEKYPIFTLNWTVLKKKLGCFCTKLDMSEMKVLPQKNCQKFPKVDISLHKLPWVGISSQRLPKVLKNCQKLPWVAQNCHKFPQVLKSCHILPKVPNEFCGRLSIWVRGEVGEEEIPSAPEEAQEKLNLRIYYRKYQNDTTSSIFSIN